MPIQSTTALLHNLHGSRLLLSTQSAWLRAGEGAEEHHVSCSCSPVGTGGDTPLLLDAPLVNFFSGLTAPTNSDLSSPTTLPLYPIFTAVSVRQDMLLFLNSYSRLPGHRSLLPGHRAHRAPARRAAACHLSRLSRDDAVHDARHGRHGGRERRQAMTARRRRVVGMRPTERDRRRGAAVSG